MGKYISEHLLLLIVLQTPGFADTVSNFEAERTTTLTDVILTSINSVFFQVHWVDLSNSGSFFRAIVYVIILEGRLLIF